MKILITCCFCVAIICAAMGAPPTSKLASPPSKPAEPSPAVSLEAMRLYVELEAGVSEDIAGNWFKPDSNRWRLNLLGAGDHTAKVAMDVLMTHCSMFQPGIKLISFKDDKETNLLGPPSRPIGGLMEPDGYIPYAGHLFRIASWGSPARDAKYLVAKGTVTMLSGEEEKQVVVKGLSLPAHITAGIVDFELEKPRGWLRLIGKPTLNQVKDISFITDDGEITSSMDWAYTMQEGNGVIKMWRSLRTSKPLPAKFDARITYWNVIKPVVVPFEVKVGLGSLASTQLAGFSSTKPSPSSKPSSDTKPAVQKVRPLLAFLESPSLAAQFPPDAAKQQSSNVVDFKGGMYLAGTISASNRVFLRLLEADSKLDSLGDDTGTDLMTGGPGADKSCLRFLTFSDDRRKCVLAISAQSLPAAGATEVLATGTLTMICGTNPKQAVAVTLTANKTVRATVGKIPVDIGFHGGYLELSSDQPLDVVTGVSVLETFPGKGISLNGKIVTTGQGNCHLGKMWEDVVSGNRIYYVDYVLPYGVLPLNVIDGSKVSATVRYVEKTETVKVPIEAQQRLGS